MGYLNDYFKHLSNILKTDKHYKEEAYLFVIAALGRAFRALKEPRHIAGAELLAAIREEAEEQFGPMSSNVFQYWGIKNSLDFGKIVFNMVREGILSKTEEDCLDDFKDVLFFDSLFDETLGYRLNLKEGVLNNVSN